MLRDERQHLALILNEKPPELHPRLRVEARPSKRISRKGAKAQRKEDAKKSHTDFLRAFLPLRLCAFAGNFLSVFII
jgi:hypothetical protein